MKQQFKIRVLDKEKKIGFLWNTYSITVRILENGTVFSSNVSVQQYYDMEIGSEWLMTLYKHSNGLWYSSPE